ncbi:MAG TPA: LysM peptidoglycan-binding domain-containing protein, partial [Candidatus Sulfotelmatobacter sp.]|nr:LysM peptidoglycan-binding domain-containing protein [Candidatus Sulfotelmatobacter sp.]
KEDRVPKKLLKKSLVRESKPFSAKKVGYLSQINWGESYTSLFLGAVVVVVALILLFSFLKARSNQNQQTQSNSTSSEELVNGRPTSYVVKSGENLWQISEKIFKSGYNWVDIANANHLANPGILFVGTKLVIPNVEPKEITVKPTLTVENSIRGSTYTVVKGDYLWSIAIRAYGDGYKWTEIAKANNLSNPNLIYSGNVLRLPR